MINHVSARILNRLVIQPASVELLAQELQVEPAKVRHHVRVLETCGLVTDIDDEVRLTPAGIRHRALTSIARNPPT